MPALAIALVAAATLAGAWFFQLVLDIRPCPLCLEQRYAYYIAVPLALLVAFVASRGAPRQVVLAGFALLLLAVLANAWLLRNLLTAAAFYRRHCLKIEAWEAATATPVG